PGWCTAPGVRRGDARRFLCLPLLGAFGSVPRHHGENSTQHGSLTKARPRAGSQYGRMASTLNDAAPLASHNPTRGRSPRLRTGFLVVGLLFYATMGFGTVTTPLWPLYQNRD